MVDEDNMNASALAAAQGGQVPFGDEFYIERNGQPLLVKKQVVLTGDRLTDAQPGFDNQTQEPAVHLTLDATGARIFKEYTRENVGKRMAILLIEKGRGEVVTAPVIRSEIGGGRVQISGRMTTVEANDVALLLRAGALAAPWRSSRSVPWVPRSAQTTSRRLRLDDLRLRRAVALHRGVLLAVRGVLHARAVRQPAVPDRVAVDAPGHAHPAGHRGYRAHARHGDRRERPHQRARARGVEGGATPQAAIHAGYERAFGTIASTSTSHAMVPKARS